MVKSRVFQLTVEEARVAPNVVKRMFLVNKNFSLVFFYLGASQSFVSFAFIKNFNVALGALDHPFVMKIANDHSMRALRIYDNIF